MGSSQTKYLPEWVSDYRRSRRWVDSRTVLGQVDGEETLGKTVDVSVGGMKVEFPALSPLAGRRLKMALVFDGRVIDLDGTVLHRTPRGEGSCVGVEFEFPLEPEAAAFLAVQYPPTMEGEGTDFTAIA